MTYPVVSRQQIEPVKRGLFRGRRQAPDLPKVEAGHVRLFKVDGSYVVARTPGEINWGELEQVVDVDVRPNRCSFDLVVPSRTDAYSFSVEASVVCTVSDPVLVASRAVDDLVPTIKSVVERSLWASGRGFDIEDADACEQRMQQVLLGVTSGDGGLVGSGLGLSSASVRITLDEGSRAHIRQLKEIKRREDIVRAEHQTTKTAEELEMQRQVAKAAMIAQATASPDGALAMATASGELSYRELAEKREEQQDAAMAALDPYYREQVVMARVLASLKPEEQAALQGTLGALPPPNKPSEPGAEQPADDGLEPS